MVKRGTLMNKRRAAGLLVALGVCVAVGGVGLVYIPAALILGGLAVAGIGLFVIDADVKK